MYIEILVCKSEAGLEPYVKGLSDEILIFKGLGCLMFIFCVTFDGFLVFFAWQFFLLKNKVLF